MSAPSDLPEFEEGVPTVVEYDLTYAEDHIAIFWLSRPEAKNAVNSEVSHQMHLLQDRFEADDNLWVGIVAAVRAHCISIG